MYVVKRKGTTEQIDINKIIKRILYLVEYPSKLNGIDVLTLAQQVVRELRSGISTRDIDEFTADRSASMISQHLDYGILSGRIVINNHHKNTQNSFRDKIEELYLRKDFEGNSCPLISDSFYKFVIKNQKEIENYISYDRDYLIDFFGFKTLEKSYLLRVGGKIIERPQDLWMRVAIFVNMTNDFHDQDVLKNIFATYDLYSLKKICQASPTMFNSGGLRPQVFSCFLMQIKSDSLEGINETFNDMAKISKWAGGIGIHVSNIRATGSIIRSTNGPAAGLVPIMKMYNTCMCMYNQGGKRPGNAACFIEPHHADIFRFLDLKRIHGDDKLRARDLFYAVWISDLFMERVRDNKQWSLFCPNKCPRLNDVWGDEYKKLYERYESEGKAVEVVPAQSILYAIYESMKESGVPYIGFKDNVNRHNMQSNMGTIKSSNLCHEIMLYSDEKEYAVCCLGNMVLPNYVYDSWSVDEEKLPLKDRRELNHEYPTNPIIDYLELVNNTRHMIRNLDKLLDKNYYPVIETARSAFKTRAIGIGIQGLADVFMKFRVPFESPAAAVLNKNIFEAIHYGSVAESVEICRNVYKQLVRKVNNNGTATIYPIPEQVLNQYPELKNEELYKKYTKTYTNASDIPKMVGAYPAYLENGGSPLANGKFHWELYDAEPSGLFDWESLRGKIAVYGVRHSHVNAAMPTASTSQIMGSIESFEPFKQNIYMRKTQAGEYTVINKYLYRDMEQKGIDINLLKNYLMVNNGSIQHMPGISAEMKALYKTAYEMSQKSIINLARDRQPFIDQGQSMNLFFQNFTYDKHYFKVIMHAWKSGLKTGSYYMRTRAAASAQNLTLDPEVEKKIKESAQLPVQGDDEVICLACQ